MDAEVGVIGIGTLGSMATLELARKNTSVIGFEQFWIGHDRSAGAGDTRLFRTPHSQKYKKMYHDAYELWHKLGEETNQKLLTLGNALIIGESESRFIRNAINNLTDYHSKYDILDKKQAELHFPQHKLLPNEIIIKEKNAGYLRPELSILSVVERAKELGAIIKSYTRVDRIETRDDMIKIWANGTEYVVEKLLITAGPWTNRFLLEYKDLIMPKRLISTWFMPKNCKEFSPNKFPVFIRMNNEFGIYGTPSVDSSMVKVSIRKEHININDPDSLNMGVSTKEISRISNIIGKYLPGLYDTPSRAAVYMDGYTEDNEPIIGNLPNNENVVVLGGYSGHGFKLAPVMGKIGADLLLEGLTEYSIESLSPTRFNIN